MTRKEIAVKSDLPETKERILASALTIFGEKGFHNTTMAEIAEDANVGKGTLYWYFSSKESLFAGMIEQGIQRLRWRIQSILNDDTLLFSELFLKYIKEYFYYFYEHRQLARLFLSNHSGLGGELRAKMIQWNLDFNKINQKLIVKGLRAKIFREDLEVDRAAKAFSGLITAFGSQQLWDGDRGQIEVEVAFIYKLMIDGIGVKEGMDRK